MPTSTLTGSTTIGGVSITGQIVRTATGQISQSLDGDSALAAGKAGTLTTRTDNDTGVATVSTGHGIITADKVDVYWEDGIRYGMDATVAVNAVTIDGGAGDNLPILTTALVVCKQTIVDTDFDGATVEQIIAAGSTRCHLHFQQGGGTSIFAVEIPSSREFWEWHTGSPVTNPFGTDVIGKVCVSNGDSSTVCTLKIGVLYDSEA